MCITWNRRNAKCSRVRKVTERRIVHAIDLVLPLLEVSILSSLASKSRLQLRPTYGSREPQDAMPLMSLTPLTPLVCPQCGRTYKMKRNLKTHMKFECGGQRNFMCHLCPSKYTQNISLRRHLLQRHNLYMPPKFSVPKQPLSVATRGFVDETLKNNVVFTCHQCGRTYQIRHNLLKHLRYECGGQKHFACSLCPSRYTQNGKLRQHMLNAHNVIVPPRKSFYESFQPPENPAAYGRKAYATPTKIAKVRTSARSPGNAEDQTLQCSACGKRYSLKHNLARHVRFECGGQRRFSCHLCPNKATCKRAPREDDAEDKWRIGRTCAKNASQRSEYHRVEDRLDIKLAMKLAQQPGFLGSRFTCRKCGRGYTMLCNLRRHMKWECGGKRYFPCYYCSKSFTQKTSLQRHLTGVHNIDIVNGTEPNLML
ncbi:PREDICTED: gastrula zinc finger protein XlCGF57.1-like [Vollenhovia emeryi]|uniref:gastrula zinc finger protein XlCGF57.1-like n=1 Tax=Vollenhovia emeryi TaxID=411798 RepID=UPI0005F46F9B|nr:PREDICTED: gastrula zinc finger protein XlCGF57.1-like [Vollenhovia emeryi]